MTYFRNPRAKFYIRTRRRRRFVLEAWLFGEIAVISGAALFKDPRVEAAMLSCDRKNYCPRDPYNDSPQPIGKLILA